MVKGVINNDTTLYVNAAYQITNPQSANPQITKYYPGGAFRVGGVLYYALGDHLGSTSVITDANGANPTQLRYTAWGGLRYSGAAPTLLTDRTFTGQRTYVSDFGLMYYNARWYDGGTGRFAQADTIVPGGVQGLDRYAYTGNNPVNFTDPSGHSQCDYIPGGTAHDECSKSIGEPTQSNNFVKPDTQGPDQLHENLLTEKAQELYSLYQKMYSDTNKWWWDAYGDDGHFSIWEFMAVMWTYEQAGYSNNKNIRTSMANHAAAWCNYMGCNRASAEGSLSFLAGYSYSAMNRARKVLSGAKTLDEVFYKPPWSQSNGMAVVSAIRYRPSLALYPLRPGNLYDFGNVSLSNAIIGKMIKWGMVYDNWGSGNTFVVMTKCQSDLYVYALFNGGPQAINYRAYGYYCGG